MKRNALIATLVLAVLAAACGFGGTTVALTVTQPAVPGAHQTVLFSVQLNESRDSIAARLQKAGLIRNATLFSLLAYVRKLSAGLKQGTFSLSAGMSMDQIIQTLEGTPLPENQVSVTFGPGWRVTQYPYPVDPTTNPPSLYQLKTRLPYFNADDFLKIATMGIEPNGTKLWTKYWYVEQPQQNVKFALEGYLYPDTYLFNASDDATHVVERLLNNFGIQLCPGPQDNPGAYFNDQAQCRAHARTLDDANKTNLFDALEARYFTKDDTLALYDGLTIGSLAIREINGNDANAAGVAGVYYNRYLVSLNKLSNPPNDFVGFLGSDPSAEYARDTDNSPADPGGWWKDLTDAGKNTDPDNPYNTENPYHHGLPPGPIAAPLWPEIAAAANPQTKPVYFYLVTDTCNPPKVHYAYTNAQAGANNAKWLGKCPAS
jgi:UPF0755 protein